MLSVLFKPFNKTAHTDGGQTLLDLARGLGLPIAATCGGKKVCGKCRVVIEEGQAVDPPSPREQELLLSELDRGMRLACEVVPAQDMTVLVPASAIDGRQVILTSQADHGYAVRLNPACEQYLVATPALEPGQTTASRERVLSALRRTYRLGPLTMDSHALRCLPALMGPGLSELSAVVNGQNRVVDVFARRRKRLLGMAVDIGSTTVVGYLLDLASGQKVSVASAMNPQIPYGDDVISRISYCQENSGGLDRLRGAMVDCLNRIMADAAAQAGVDAGRISEVTVVGNTAMHHLFLGLDASQVARVPYVPVAAGALDLTARELGLDILPGAGVHLLPLLSGFVGADTIACVLASALYRKRIPTLLIDLGTNGEIVSGCGNGLVMCSTAAGPALEGGRLRHGMRAAPGAIDSISVDAQTLEATVHTIDDRPAVGICGSGVISALAQLIRAGVITATGGFAPDLDTPRLRPGSDGREFVLAWAAQTGLDGDLVLTQKDVAEVQLAKAAVYAGCQMAMEASGHQARRILLAGACGNYIDPKDAATVGLFPDCGGAPVQPLGNAAGHGACLALLDKGLRQKAARIAAQAQYLELAGTARFQELFTQGMLFTAAPDYEDGF